MTTDNLERMRVLRMVEAGSLSAEQADRLLLALTGGGPDAAAAVDLADRSVRIVVTDVYTGRTQVNVKIPAGLVDMALRLGAYFLPPGGGMDLDDLLETVRSGVTGKVAEFADDEEDRRIEVFIE